MLFYLTPVRSRGARGLSWPKLRRQTLIVRNPVTPTDWPELNLLRPETTQDQGKSSHPLATHPEKREEVELRPRTTNRGSRVVLPKGATYLAALIPPTQQCDPTRERAPQKSGYNAGQLGAIKLLRGFSKAINMEYLAIFSL